MDCSSRCSGATVDAVAATLMPLLDVAGMLLLAVAVMPCRCRDAVATITAVAAEVAVMPSLPPKCRCRVAVMP